MIFKSRHFVTTIAFLIVTLIVVPVFAQSKKMSTDALVIGAAASGLCAALTIAEAGAQVVMLEKLPMPGGTSNFAEGLFAVESHLQRKEKIGLTKDEAFLQHMSNTNWRANARLVRAYIDKSADSIDWLEKRGVEFESVASVFPDGPRTWHIVKGLGAGLVKPLVDRAMATGKVTMLLETPAQKLLKEKGRIVGCIAVDKEGNEIEILSKTVIVAAGGYTNNAEMVETYVKGGKNAVAAVPLNLVGGPIKMAWDVGAAPDGLGVVMAIVGVTGETIDSQLLAAAAQPALWVNRKGIRFCDENIFFNFPFAANALANQPDGVAYCIFDESLKNKWIQQGIDTALGQYVPVDTRLDQLEEHLAKGIKAGKAFKAGSIEELAEKLMMASGDLQSTIKEYNGYCDSGHDALFVKDRRLLHSLKTPNFYAIKLTVQILTTLGGIKINEDTQVLDTDGEIIPGLFAVGNCAGGMYGDSYELETSGGAFGFAVNSGRIAGENALKLIKE
jgi:fumarate reductase flavoprotein subunit